MGVGGHFWDLLKPYARTEGFDFIRNKRVAVDLSFWIIQHDTAIKTHTRNPHLRLTFFRTINLFAKFGAFPVFVVDGIPSPLKSRAIITRFFRSSGVDVSSFLEAEDDASFERNHKFMKQVKECVELLELLGMPVLRAKGEAEALCAQLNSEGHVDACITSDSDAFLFGAKCIIKCFSPNSKEPFVCYHMSDIEAGLGLTRKHLIAISLLVGNDHDLNGVQGIGLDSALRFVQDYSEDDILNRLREIGNGDILPFQGSIESVNGCRDGGDESSPKSKTSHCSICGHPGSKNAHLKFQCKYCGTRDSDGCVKKPKGFKCNCSSCNMNRKENELKKLDNWRVKVCNKIAMKPNFPNDEILQMYLCNNHGYISENDDPLISWGIPNTEMLVDFLAFNQLWAPSFIRQRVLPMLSTIFLREMARSPHETLLSGQYEFDSIHREKIRYGHPFYVIKWKKATHGTRDVICKISSEGTVIQEQDIIDVDEDTDLSNEPDAPEIHIDDGCSFLLTDENVDLVRAAFPEKVDRFLEEKERNEVKKRKSSSSLKYEGTPEKPESPISKGLQMNITDFYRSSKLQLQAKSEDLVKDSGSGGEGASTEKRKPSSSNLSKSVRRRLLFDK